MRHWFVRATALLASAMMSVPAWACGFEDPSSASLQRVMLSVVYPDALYVQGAVDTALSAGVLRPGHFTRPGDFFALQRTTRNLRRFSDRLSAEVPTGLPAFSMVLMGPVLWTRFHPGSDGIVAEPHVAGPPDGGIVMVTDVPALAALVAGDVSGAEAVTTGLVRFYGDGTDGLREALTLAFPGHANQTSLRPARNALLIAR